MPPSRVPGSPPAPRRAPAAVAATVVSTLWADRLTAAGVADAAAWRLALGAGAFPQPAQVVARRLLELSKEPRATAAAVESLHDVLREVVGEASPDAQWWQWFGELSGTLAWSRTSSGDIRLAMAFHDGVLGTSDGTRTPAQSVADALVETARRAVTCDSCEFAIDGLAEPGAPPRDAGTHAASAPVHGGGVLGTLVMRRAARPFDRRERAFLHALAVEAGFALDAFAIAERERRHAASLALLYRVSCQLQVDLELETVLDAVCEAVCAITDAERAVVLELRSDGSLERVGSYHMDVTVRPELGERGLATSLARAALAGGGPVIANVDQLVHEVGPAVLEHLGVRRSLGCVPLRAAGQAVGLVFFDRTGREFSLDQTQRENCETVANLAALAIERVRLHQAKRDAARLQERERIAYELHDSVIQQLFRVGLELRSVAESTPAMADQLAPARRLLAEASAHLRHALQDEAPARLRARLDDAVHAACSAFSVRTTVPCACKVDLPGEPPEPLAVLVERFVGEGLANVEKHAGAGRVEVRVGYADAALSATVVDDGRGTVRDNGNGAGLAMLNRDAAAWGGEVHLVRAPEGGATLSLSLPWVVRA